MVLGTPGPLGRTQRGDREAEQPKKSVTRLSFANVPPKGGGLTNSRSGEKTPLGKFSSGGLTGGRPPTLSKGGPRRVGPTLTDPQKGGDIIKIGATGGSGEG